MVTDTLVRAGRRLFGFEARESTQKRRQVTRGSPSAATEAAQKAFHEHKKKHADDPNAKLTPPDREAIMNVRIPAGERDGPSPFRRSRSAPMSNPIPRAAANR